VQVSQNGILELWETRHEPSEVLHNFSSFPVESRTFITPFHAEIDLSSVGMVYYSKPVTDSVALDKATQQISNSFTQYKNFMAKYLIVATWVGIQDSTGTNLNTFQCVTATDRVMTFAIFLYDKLQWSKADDTGFARVGFNNGIEDTCWEMPCSGTESITSLASSSNVGEPGVWAFRVDQKEIIPACTDKDTCEQDMVRSCLRESKHENCGCTTEDLTCTKEPSGGVGPTDEQETNIGAIVGGVMVVLLTIAAILIAYCMYKKCKEDRLAVGGSKTHTGAQEYSSKNETTN
jgi:hypothetical protein